MPDRLSLSLWLKKGHTLSNPISSFEKLVRTLPISRLAQAASTLRILAVSFSEPPVAEQEVELHAPPEVLAELAGEFYNPDSCFQLDTWWDLWTMEGDWRLAPARITVMSFAEEFDRPDGEDLRIEFGLESQFLPPPGDPRAARIIQSNITSLLRFVQELEQNLPVARRMLVSESGENFAAQLQRALQAGADEAGEDPVN